MKISRLIPLVLTLCLLMSVCVPAVLAEQDPYADTQPYVASKYALIADMDSGRILYEKGAHEKHPPASITKIMTALLCIEAIERGEMKLDDVITAPDDCREGVPDDASTAHIVAGEIMTLENILYCMLMPSANEACNIVASLMADSREAFVDMMNERAALIGCTETHFNNPNGISNDNHYTTPYDLFLIARECMKHELFAYIVNVGEYDVPATNKSEARHLTNTNAMKNNKSFYGDHYVYPGTFGVKTGHTELAGYNLVTCVERNGIRLMAVVFGGYAHSKGFSHFDDSINLYDWAFNEYRSELLLEEGTGLADVAVSDGKDAFSVELVTMKDVSAVCGSLISASELTQDIRIYRNVVSAPVEKGAVLGEVSYTGPDGTVYASVPLVAANSVDAQGVISGGLFSHVWVWIVLVILLVIIGFCAYMVISYKRHNARLARRRQGAHEVTKNEKK